MKFKKKNYTNKNFKNNHFVMDLRKERIEHLGTEGMFLPQTDVNHYRYYYRY
jgi:hypothetical protein